MKKSILFIAILFISGLAIAQADITNAFSANQKGQFEKAVGYIEKAIVHPKGMLKEKTWRYRGDIYLNVALDSVLIDKFPNALLLAKDSYLKAKELDTKKSYWDEDNSGLDKVQKLAANQGYTNYVAGTFDKAGDAYALAANLATSFDIIDTVSLYNAAISYEKAEMNGKAIEYYNQCADLGHNVPDIYLFISNIQKRMGDDEASIQTIKDARAKHPNSQSLIIEELNYYLTSGRDKEAKENLKLAIEKDPSNKILHFSLGTIHDKLEESEEAEVAYAAAIAIDGDYTDALYNLGALHFNKGVAVIKIANDLPPDENKKYTSLVADSEQYFESAMPFLERAYELTGDDIQIMDTLKNVYARVGADDKYMELKKKMDSM